MIYLISIFIIGLFIKEVVIPVVEYNQEMQALAYLEEFKFHKLKVIKTFYPKLRGMSYDEINERFSVDRVYHSIGRKLR